MPSLPSRSQSRALITQSRGAASPSQHSEGLDTIPLHPILFSHLVPASSNLLQSFLLEDGNTEMDFQFLSLHKSWDQGELRRKDVKENLPTLPTFCPNSQEIPHSFKDICGCESKSKGIMKNGNKMEKMEQNMHLICKIRSNEYLEL